MAALRIFARTVLSTCRQYSGVINYSWNYCAVSGFQSKQPHSKIFPQQLQVCRRRASFKTSPVYNEETKYTEFETFVEPEEWTFVERCLKSKYIPIPPNNVEILPSGWKPQKSDAKNLPYFVERSKNHLYPVYLRRSNRGMRRLTVIRKIQGDIITLEADLRTYLEKSTGNNIGSQILEPSGMIKFRGDHVSLVKHWLNSKGI